MSLVKTYIVPHPPIILPEIGRGEEQKIIDTVHAYREIAKEISVLAPDTIIISSPHAQSYLDYFHISPGKKAQGDFSNFGIRGLETEVIYDKDLVQLIEKEAKKRNINAGTQGEKNKVLDHGTMVPLYFIQKVFKNFKLVRISPSGLSALDHYQLGKLIYDVIPNKKKVVWIASGDLSHKLKKDGPYGLAKEGPIFDQEIVDIIEEGNLLKLMDMNPKVCNNAAECGLNSFIMMSGALDTYEYDSKLCSYEGPFGVGYAVASFTPTKKIESRGNGYKEKIQEEIKHKRKSESYIIHLARESLEYYTKTKSKLPLPKDVPEDLINKKAGVFVSLHKKDQLRGCVGTILPTTSSIAREVIDNAVAAGFHDYRFPMIKEKELMYLQYKVDVIMPPEKIESINLLDVVKYGVIVSSGSKRGLLLPNLEGIDTVEYQVHIAKQKAGIYEYEDFELERFEVIRYE